MRKYGVMSLAALLIGGVMFCVVPVQAHESHPAEQSAFSDEEVTARLNSIEDRLKRAKLVVRKLKHDYLQAMENSDAMKQGGISAEDVERIDTEFKHKVQMMIDQAVEDINDV